MGKLLGLFKCFLVFHKFTRVKYHNEIGEITIKECERCGAHLNSNFAVGDSYVSYSKTDNLLSRVTKGK